jgi:hypothetical protein|tara:strand:- start:373 stop:540 length:168 start_codon:yes stop_codon:yes gene_type:complete
MATFRNRGTKKDPLVQVQIRRKDYAFQNRTFKSDAVSRAWARDIDLVFKALAALI